LGFASEIHLSGRRGCEGGVGAGGAAGAGVVGLMGAVLWLLWGRSRPVSSWVRGVDRPGLGAGDGEVWGEGSTSPKGSLSRPVSRARSESSIACSLLWRDGSGWMASLSVGGLGCGGDWSGEFGTVAGQLAVWLCLGVGGAVSGCFLGFGAAWGLEGGVDGAWVHVYVSWGLGW